VKSAALAALIAMLLALLAYAEQSALDSAPQFETREFLR
jgi:hypothetical protein